MGAKVFNVERFKAKLAAIPQGVRDAASDALAEGAGEIVAAQKRFAPKDTGELAGSIRWDWAGRGGGGGSAGLRNGRAALLAAKGAMYLAIKITAGFGMKIPMVARWKEFGTKDQPAHPYFFTGFRVNKKRVVSRVVRVINKALKATGKR